MSIVNGKQKRVYKKQNNVSTAAVYPILQLSVPITNGKKPVNAEIFSSPDSIVSDSTVQLFRGQCIRGRPVVYVFIFKIN